MREYEYVGPRDIREAALASGAGSGTAIRRAGDLAGWLAGLDPDERTDPLTFVVDRSGTLRVARRRSEHVACAAGATVLAAGEIAFGSSTGQWAAVQVSNHSTGYCPDPAASWPAVAAALGRAGIGHPGGYTAAVVFRRCPECAEIAVVKDDDYVCVFCESGLPADWNVTPGPT